LDRFQGLTPLAINFWPVGPAEKRRRGFTLFELILAIALAAVLLGVIGTALKLYLVRVEASRTRVEEAQLARSILTMIANDIRATAIYQPQDTSAIAQMMANGTEFDVDSIDDERSDESGGSGGTTSGASLSGSGSGGASAFSTSGGTGSGSGASSSSMSSSSGTQQDTSMPLGLSGSLNELYVDVDRLPRRDELFSTLTGYTNAPLPPSAGPTTATVAGAATMVPKLSELRTIRYFVREGIAADASGLAGTSLSPEMQARGGGLVRQEIPRPARDFAEQYGGSNVLETGQTLVAPEVVNLQFRYFSGEEVTDVWDMQEERVLPVAVEVTISLVSPNDPAAADGTVYDMASLPANAREYRQTVFLPMAELSQSAASGGMAGGSSSGMGSSSSSTTGSGTGSGSSMSSSSTTGGSGFGTSQ
jgi:prepilin-type N-terminal cleavage/methylation domain-containing protein